MCVFCIRIRLLRTLCSFCVRICLSVRIKRLLRMYTAFCALWAAFCIRIRLFVRYEQLFAYGYGFFDSFKVSVIRYWGFLLFEVPMIWSWGFVDFLKVLAKACDNCTAWRIRSSGFLVRRSAHSDWTILRILSSGLRQILYLTLFTWFTVQY